ncbi:hypothetical protein [Clostridium sp.]|uniref:hypothetical protein n=1 Tax=Clostridium sp. TaxID=1506 RepID=UPI0025C59D1F|nr:hypothetical protein [Clostridium sp.]
MKVSINNKKIFKYKGVVHIVSEIKEDIKGFTGCYQKREGIKYCLINSNLSPMKKRRTLHNLIKDKHLTRG